MNWLTLFIVIYTSIAISEFITGFGKYPVVNTYWKIRITLTYFLFCFLWPKYYIIKLVKYIYKPPTSKV